MQKGAASCMSVEAPRAKLRMRGAGGGDQRRIQLSSVAEAPDVQVDEHHQHEGEAGRGQARRPVVHAKFAEGEHGAPVVESRLFQPGMAPQDGRDVVAAREHLARDLRIARLVGADQAEPIAAKDRAPNRKREKRRSGQTGLQLLRFRRQREIELEREPADRAIAPSRAAIRLGTARLFRRPPSARNAQELALPGAIAGTRFGFLLILRSLGHIPGG